MGGREGGGHGGGYGAGQGRWVVVLLLSLNAALSSVWLRGSKTPASTGIQMNSMARSIVAYLLCKRMHHVILAHFGLNALMLRGSSKAPCIGSTLDSSDLRPK